MKPEIVDRPVRGQYCIRHTVARCGKLDCPRNAKLRQEIVERRNAERKAMRGAS
jgi:hypothetical protein